MGGVMMNGKKINLVLMAVCLFAGCATTSEYPKAAVNAFYAGSEAYNKDNYNKAVAMYTKAIEIKSDYASAFYWRCRANLANGDTESAKKDFAEYMLLNPDYDKWTERLFSYYFSVPNEAYQAYMRGQKVTTRNKRIAEYTEAIRIAPDFFAPYNERGVDYRYKYMFLEVEDDFNKAISLDPTHFLPYFNMGEIYLEKGEKDKAISYFNLSLRYNPYYTDAENSLRKAQRGETNSKSYTDRTGDITVQSKWLKAPTRKK